MADTITQADLLQRLKNLPAGRQLVAVAGAPASGKSTLAAQLAEALNAEKAQRAAVVPMDGYHYDDRVLEARGQRPRKGAPFTFDVDGFRHMLQRLKNRDEAEVAIPVFDRSIEIARAAAAILPQAVEIIVVEGNYLLLQQAPWNTLHALFDLTIFLDVPEPVLRQRLEERWVHYKLTAAQIAAKLEENDLPNGRLIRSESIEADLVVQGV